MNLSKHFTYEEFIASNEAVRRGIDNTPSPEILKNLQHTAVKAEEVRLLLGHPMSINSGYRCPDLNFAIRGAKNSQHVEGHAIDFISPVFGTPYDVCIKIKDSGIKFDQLIHEFGQWTHISFGPMTRMECLTICSPKSGFRRGIFSC